MAVASEGIALRRAGIVAPILLLSEQPPATAADIVAHDLIATVATIEAIDALASAVDDRGGGAHRVHVKVDTGMHRVGVDPADVGAIVGHVAGRAPELVLDGLFTHLAVADEPANAFTGEQLRRFDAVLADLPSLDRLAIHAANSAAALTRPDARRSLVRAGIAVYGISPFAGDTAPTAESDLGALLSSLPPALALKARVSAVRRVDRGERLSYGLRHVMAAPANVATVPIGYADGVRRNLSGTGTTVLIDGRHRPIIGMITMDQLMVDCGDDGVAVGDEVVLIGRQGEEVIRAEDWATTLGTIGYEIVCGIGPRVHRQYIQTAE